MKKSNFNWAVLLDPKDLLIMKPFKVSFECLVEGIHFDLGLYDTKQEAEWAIIFIKESVRLFNSSRPAQKQKQEKTMAAKKKVKAKGKKKMPC